MSTAANRVLVCKRKILYRTDEDAWSAAVAATLKFQCCIYYYQCPFCKGYHLTKKLAGKKREKLKQKTKLEEMLARQREQRKQRQAPKKKMRRIRQQYLRGEISLEVYHHYGRIYDRNPSKF